MDRLVENIRNITVNDNNSYHLEDTYKMYLEYLKKLSELEERKTNYFLRYLKDNELSNNQETEFEEPFITGLTKLSQRQNSINTTMKLFEKGFLTKEDIKKIHRLVIKGSSDDTKNNYEFRMDNEKWVGSFVNGKRDVHYIPPDYKIIDELLNQILLYLNEKNYDEHNIFIKPLIVHALLAYVQSFGNGNTRLARVIQHCKVCTMSNEMLGYNFSTPTFYLSENYLKTRPQYRELIKKIAADKDMESWNKWFNYNLNMIDEQLYFLDNNLTKYRRK